MTSIFNHLQDSSLASKYSLQELLGESKGAAFFRTTFGPEQRPAVLKLIPETSSAAGEEQLKLWRIAARIAHPNMLRLLDHGRADEEGGDHFLYAVFEFPDDTLAGAVGRGPLSAEETREVLVAVVEGLRYIHSQGLVHTAVDPSHVVAVGNQIKLATDTLCLPSRDATTAEDVRSLGALVYQLISGRRVEPGTDPDLSSIPEPFRSIIQHSLVHDPNQRWSPPQLAAAIDSPPSQDASPLEPARPARSVSSRTFPKWIYVATPVFLIVLILVFREIKPRPEPIAARPAPVAQTPLAPKPASTRSWRVIAYTYSRRAVADKKAQSINRKWSGAQAEVLAPGTGKPGAYLVALGGPMNRDEAVRFLKTARSKGMPRAAYVRSDTP
jgi:eukaryotic-like serine/threonine-protein kinase